MTLHLGNVPAGTTLYIPFSSYDGATGASEAISGLSVTDIEIYKNGSVTQRSSDNGYALLDTDGIDFDGLVGINGFSVDLSDNTDAGFYAVGSMYWVVVASITADAQTVNFIAATFRLVAAEATAGYTPVTIKSGTGTGEVSLSSGLVTLAAVTHTGAVIPTVTTVTTTTTATSVTNDVGITQTGADKVWGTAARTLTAGTNITLPNAQTFSTSGSVASVTGAVGSVAAGGITAASFGAGAIDAAALAADAGQEVADALLGRNVAGGSSAGRTVKQALAVLRNKVTVSGGTLTVYDTDDTTILYTAAVTTAAGDPIDSIDP